MLKISDNLYQYEDTCNVYVIKNGSDAVLIDFGTGAVLDELESIGVNTITEVLMTHHHRDQGQGLARALEVGARIWVPHIEQDLFQHIDLHWLGREIYNNYNVRQDKFSLLEPVPISGTLKDYASYTFGGRSFTIAPTPGHTTGSITLKLELDGKRLAFTGDLIAAPGKVWSMAATQWSYNGCEGIVHTMVSLSELREQGLDMLLPSHGEVMAEPVSAMDLLAHNLEQLLHLRNHYGQYEEYINPQFIEVTPHLIWNERSFANSYTLISKSGKALVIDYGYPNNMDNHNAGTERSARRPSLFPIERLKKKYNLTKIDVVIPTHYHDDHVAGFNLLRDVEGTQTWVPDAFADIFERPSRYDVPCIWYDPIPVDRRLSFNESVIWEEYEIRIYEQPGHALYAVAIEFEVDGKRVLAIGDQQDNEGYLNNYVYKNKFRSHDYILSAELYQKLNPDLIISGHWEPLWIKEGYWEKLKRDGEKLKSLHDELLPLQTVDMGAEGFCAWIKPYQMEVENGEKVGIEVELLNPISSKETVTVQLITPAGWKLEKQELRFEMDAHATEILRFFFTPPKGIAVKRARIAVDVTVGNRKFGQQAEALVTVK